MVALEYYFNLLIFVCGYEWRSLVMYDYLLLTCLWMVIIGYVWLQMVIEFYL